MDTRFKPTKLKLPEVVETAVLAESRRRCALCFGLDYNLERKQGQIAHLDPDSPKCDLDNLVWLCLRHHGAFHSGTNRHILFTTAAVREYRRALYSVLAEQALLSLTIREGSTGARPRKELETVAAQDSGIAVAFYTGAYSDELRGIFIRADITNLANTADQVVDWTLRFPLLRIELAPAAVPLGYCEEVADWRNPVVIIPPRKLIRGRVFFTGTGVLTEHLPTEPLSGRVIATSLDGRKWGAKVAVYRISTLSERPELFRQERSRWYPPETANV